MVPKFMLVTENAIGVRARLPRASHRRQHRDDEQHAVNEISQPGYRQATGPMTTWEFFCAVNGNEARQVPPSTSTTTVFESPSPLTKARPS